MARGTEGFYRGVNLGGWLSQCDYSEERLRHFIEERDFETIASWGFDHVRIPVDYNVVWEPERGMREDGLLILENALETARKNGLNAVIDLHKTPGFSFDAAEGESGFFENADAREPFYRIWECFAQRFGARQDSVMFELLNEVTEEAYLPAWKMISSECIRRIRAHAPETRILLGSFHHNNVRTVPALDPPQDENVLYNFHCYDPIGFTHQGAYWMPELAGIRGVSYEASGASEEYFEELFAPAIRKAKAEGTALYCGEYGVIDVADPKEALRWFRAIHAVFVRHGIARSVWSYKQMDFGIADARYDAYRDELLTLL